MEWSNLIGQQLGQYELLSELGRGTYARVYQAFQPRLRRHVAVKVLRIHENDHAQFVQIFEQIAQANAQLNHPAIVSIYDFGEERGLAYIVMQSVTGGTYKRRLGKPMAVGEAVTPIVQMARALHHAHQRGVLHLDVRPENILIDQESASHLLLTDFSLSQLFQADHLARTGLPIGSPAYLAPEQIEGQRLTARTDVYALGALLFEELAGQAAFSAPTAAMILSKHLHEPPPYVRGFNPAVPRELAHVVGRAMAKRPEERYESAEEFARALDPYRDAKERHHRLSLRLEDLNLPDDEALEGGAPAPSPARSRASGQPGTHPSGPDQAGHTIESAPVQAPLAGTRRGAPAEQSQWLRDFPVLLGHEPEVPTRIPLVQQVGNTILHLARRVAGTSSAGQWLDHQVQRAGVRLATGITSIALVLLLSLSAALLAAALPPQRTANPAPIGLGFPTPASTVASATATLIPTDTPSPTATPSGPAIDPGAAAVFAGINVSSNVNTSCQKGASSAMLPAGRSFYITLCFNARAIPGGGTASIEIVPQGASGPVAQQPAHIGGGDSYYWFQFNPLVRGSYQIEVYWNGKLGYIATLTVS
jgi:serine/threonine protein kinase